MTTTIMGQMPTAVYAMISGSGLITPNPTITDSTGSFMPLLTTAEGRLMVDSELVLSGASIVVELTHDTDSVAVYGSDGTDRIIKTDATGGIELGGTTLAALETVTAIISGTASVDDGGNSLTVDGAVTTNLGAPSLTFLEAKLDTSTSGDNVVISNVTSGTILTVHGYAISCGDTATNVYLKDTTTQLTHTIRLGVNGGTVEPRSIIPCFSTTTGESLLINLSAGNNVGISIYYREA